MAYATVNGRKHRVRVQQDLSTNWSIEVYPEPEPGAIKRSEPFKPWPVPLLLKVCADTRGDALVHGLEYMKKMGKIDDYQVDPSERPAPPAAAAPKKEESEEEA